MNHSLPITTLGGKSYAVQLDPGTGAVLSAYIFVKPHDKVGTWRRLKHPATLARIQAAIKPAEVCAACGQPLKGATP